jgi:hypothetical protein
MKRPMIPSRQMLHNIRQSRSHLTSLGLERRARRALAVALLAAFGVTYGLANSAPAQPHKGTVAGPLGAAQNRVLGTTSGSGGSLRRTFQCLSKDAQGNCTQNKCTRGEGGATFDCSSFSEACKNAGLVWTGSKEGDAAGGTCSVKKAPQ